MFASLYSTRFRPKRFWPDGRGYWSGHLPLAADLIDAVKPSLLVELGTYYGESYFGFCQAIQERGIDCRTHAVDTWQGDLNTGRYGASVFEAVSAYNAAHYSSFSSLLRMTFDEASDRFTDHTIDLLHIDGCHSYESVRRDFETWLPKVSKNGVILIHDIAVRKDGFGVWRFWEEISERFPSFAFWHSSGLGMLVNGNIDDLKNPFLVAMVGEACDAQTIRDYYVLCAERLSFAPRSGREEVYKCQVYSPDAAGYTEGRSQVADVSPRQWVSIDLEVPVPTGRLRLDPVNALSTVEISEIVLECASSQSILWRLDSTRLDEIVCAGTAVRIPDKDRLIVFSYGDDPQLLLPPLATPDQSGSLRFHCSLRIDPSFSLVQQSFEEYFELLSDRAKLRESLASADSERAHLRTSLEHANSKRAGLERQLLIEEQSKAHTERERALEAEIVTLQVAGAVERDRAKDLSHDIKALRSSLSWRMMTPVRLLADVFIKVHRSLLRVLYESSAFPWTGKALAKVAYAWRLPGSDILLPSNPLFSAEFYGVSNSDIPKDRNLWAHYLGFGADEGRNPHPLFITSFYLAKNSDVASTGMNALVHYYAYGAEENRWPHPTFDGSAYLSQRPDVRANGMNPLLHYWEYGRQDGGDTAARPSFPLSQAYQSVLGNAARPETLDVSSTAGAREVRGPLLSILLPTFNTPPKFLRLAIESVRRQSYPHWQLCIYDDGSSNPETLSLLKEYAALADPRFVFGWGAVNRGIAQASNAALELAQGAYVGMLDHDDELEPDALMEIARKLEEDPSFEVIYTDQDYVNVNGERTGTLLKPDWSPEMFRGVMYVNHLLVVSSELMRRVGAFDAAFDRIQDFEFMLRVSERAGKIGHVRRILYHWRSVPGSVAAGANSKGVLEPLQAAAVNAHLSRCGINAVASPHPSLSHRLRLNPMERSTFPRVLVAIREGTSTSVADAVSSILRRSTYPNLAVCVPPSLAHGLPADPRITVRDLEDVCGQLASDEFMVWIDGDLEIVTHNWIETLLLYCEQRDVTCVSPLIVREEKVWCAGLVLGMDEGVGYAMRGWTADSDGYAGSLSCSHEVSAVSGECMMISGAMFRQLGGHVKYYSASRFDGADLALRGLTIKKRNIVAPQAIVRKSTLSTRPQGWKLDEALFVDRWRDLIRQGDPFYNSNFLQETPGYLVTTAAAVGRS
jgi:O-antigen biosynthesis protein